MYAPNHLLRCVRGAKDLQKGACAKRHRRTRAAGRSDAEEDLDFTDGDMDGVDSSITCLVCHSIMSID